MYTRLLTLVTCGYMCVGGAGGNIPLPHQNKAKQKRQNLLKYAYNYTQHVKNKP